MHARTQGHAHARGDCLLPGMVPFPKTLEEVRANARLAANRDRCAYVLCRDVQDGRFLYALWTDAERVGKWWEVLETIEPQEWSA